MAKISEIDALKSIDELLASLDDASARERVLSWAWKKFVSAQTPATPDTRPSPPAKRTKRAAAGSSKAKGKGRSKTKAPLSMARDLNLKPKGKKSLDEFANAKNPNSIYEKCTVAVHYLKHELELPAVSASHVYTCFKHMKWRVPANLANSLAYTASHYGWLDTSDLANINVSTMGENLIDHDLPRVKPAKKK